MVVWEQEELRSEEVKGVFAIGALAVLYGARTASPATTTLFGSMNGFFVSGVTAFLGAFWGIYVTMTAMSMLAWNPGKIEQWTLDAFRRAGEIAFLIGALLTLLFAALFGSVILYSFYSTYTQYAFEVAAMLAVTFFAVAYELRRDRKRARLRKEKEQKEREQQILGEKREAASYSSKKYPSYIK